MKRLLIAAFTALAVAGMALPSHAATFCTLGVSGGYSIANTDTSVDIVNGPAQVLAINGLGADGPSGGLTGGCDVRNGAWLVGAWIDHTWHRADFEVTSSLLPAGVIETSIDKQISIGGRLGGYVAEKTLIYGLIGWTRVSMDALESPVLGVSFDVPRMDGWVFGGGIEVEMLPNVLVGTEYRFSDLREETIEVAPGLANLNLDTELHEFRVNVRYRFDVAGGL